MKLPEGVIEGALRIGIGKFTTDEEIDKAGEIISTAINQVRLILSSKLSEHGMEAYTGFAKEQDMMTGSSENDI